MIFSLLIGSFTLSQTAYQSHKKVKKSRFFLFVRSQTAFWVYKDFINSIYMESHIYGVPYIGRQARLYIEFIKKNLFSFSTRHSLN